VRKLDHYEGTLKRFSLPDAVLAHFPERTPCLWQSKPPLR
jgi:hypothetical protein